MEPLAQIETLEDKLRKKEEFLSAVTGLPIIARVMYLEDPSQIYLIGDKPSPIQLFMYNLTLGDGKGNYSIDLEINHEEEDNLYVPEIKWSLKFNGNEISHSWYSSIGSDAFYSRELNPPEIKRARLDIILSQLGGACVGAHELPFMNYEDYSVESLNDLEKDSYFKNIYLVIMCHMKERGLQMPPIISKDEILSGAADNGDTEAVDKMFSKMLPSLRLQLDDRCYAHVVEEADQMRDYALSMKKWFSPSIPLTEKVRFSHFECVPGASHFGRRYNIITIENDIDNYGGFTERVLAILEEDGRYGGTNLWRECNLPSLMELCSTGQVDLLLFDWRSPSYGELLMMRGDNPAGMEFDDSGDFRYRLSDGSLNDEEEMKAKAEEVEIKERWMDMVKEGCSARDVVPPPYFIVKYEGELKDISKIVSQRLGNPIQK